MTFTTNKPVIRDQSPPNRRLPSIWSKFVSDYTSSHQIGGNSASNAAKYGYGIRYSRVSESGNNWTRTVAFQTFHNEGNSADVYSLKSLRRSLSMITSDRYANYTHLKIGYLQESKELRSTVIRNLLAHGFIDELMSDEKFISQLIKHLKESDFIAEVVSDRINSKDETKSPILDEVLAGTIDKIKELADDYEEDEDGNPYKPTDDAIAKSIELVTETVKLCGDIFFDVRVFAENNGGIYLTWSNPESNKNLRVRVPATNMSDLYMYYEDESQYDSKHGISAQDLSERLKWLKSV